MSRSREIIKIDSDLGGLVFLLPESGKSTSFLAGFLLGF